MIRPCNILLLTGGFNALFLGGCICNQGYEEVRDARRDYNEDEYLVAIIDILLPAVWVPIPVAEVETIPSPLTALLDISAINR